MTLEALKQIRQTVIRQLDKAPEGRLVKSVNSGSVQYYRYCSGKKREYISKKQKQLIEELAQKKYNQEVLISVNKQINCLEHFFRTNNSYCLEKAYENTPEEFKEYIHPYALPIKEKVNIWINEKYYSRPDADKDVTFQTDKGDLVRSKSEVLIANKLYAKNIPYRYECKLVLKNGICIFPDFTIMNPNTGEVLIWEHFGLMSNQEYSESFVRKINTYLSNGYLPGKNLLCTFESNTSQLDLSIIDKMISFLQ